MGMTSGSVAIAINATTGAVSASGSGMALNIGARLAARLLGTPIADALAAGGSVASVVSAFPASVRAQVAGMAQDIADGVVAEIQANAKAIISTTTRAGRTPNPNDPNVALNPPTSAVELAIE